MEIADILGVESNRTSCRVDWVSLENRPRASEKYKRHDGSSISAIAMSSLGAKWAWWDERDLHDCQASPFSKSSLSGTMGMSYLILFRLLRHHVDSLIEILYIL